MGDFNEVRNRRESEGGGKYDKDGAKKFNDMVEKLGVVELGTIKGMFTWTNCSR